MAGRKKVRKARSDDEGDFSTENKKPKVDLDAKVAPDCKEEEEPAEPKNGAGDAASEKVVVSGSPEAKEEVEASDEASTVPELDTAANVETGRLLICGGTNWDMTGRKELPKSAKNIPANGKNLWGPHVWEEKVRAKKVVSSCVAVHSVLITSDSRAMTFGRNDKGQLGHGDVATRQVPTLVEALKNHKIVDAACGKGHTLFLTDKGVVYGCGDNKMGQLGLGTQTASVVTPTRVSPQVSTDLTTFN